MMRYPHPAIATIGWFIVLGSEWTRPARSMEDAPHPPPPKHPPRYTVGWHLGKPEFFENGTPIALQSYCCCGPYFPGYVESIRLFAEHGCNYFWLMLAGGYNNEWGTSPFWTGPGQIHDEPMPMTNNFWTPIPGDSYWSIERQLKTILEAAPDAKFFIRLGDSPPESWAKAHPDDLMRDYLGQTRNFGSLASVQYRKELQQFIRTFTAYCERQPWADRIIAYVFYPMGEGGTPLAMEGFLFDHSPVMQEAYRQFLRDKYQNNEALQAAWGNPSVTFDTVTVPRDDEFRKRNPGGVLFWPEARQVQPERDYFELQMRLFRESLKSIFAGFRDAAGPNRLIGIDAFKGNMMGWMCHPIFIGGKWKTHYGENLIASGSIGMAEMLDWPEFHIVATPHDYRCRWIGFGYDPEGIGDSIQLRGKSMMVEEDQRTYANSERGLFGSIEPGEEEAVLYRNLAASLSRGHHTYPMDVTVGYFQSKPIQRILARRRQIEAEFLNIPRADVPSVVMLVDDWAAFDTDFSCAYNDLAVIRQRIWAMNHCGVPTRTFLWDDIERDNFPRVHKLFLLPHTFRADARNLNRLRQYLFRDGNVIVFGPGSGITDGKTVSPEFAAEMLGMDFELYDYEYPRFVTIDHWAHPITAGFGATEVYGDSHRYGPVLVPHDRHAPPCTEGRKPRVALAKDDRPFVRLGTIALDYGKRRPGLVVKEFGRGAAGNGTPGERGPGDYAIVFTTAVPLPAPLLRNLARFSGTHVYTDEDDVVYADSRMVAVHTVKPGPRQIRLPRPSAVWEVISGEKLGEEIRELSFTADGPVTKWWRLQ